METKRTVELYDSTPLRDGAQAESISFSLEDKLLIAQKLDEAGIHYLEGGYPNPTNPKDIEFFRACQISRPFEDKSIRFRLDPPGKKRSRKGSRPARAARCGYGDRNDFRQELGSACYRCVEGGRWM